MGIVTNPTPTAVLVTVIERKRLRDADRRVCARAWAKVGLIWAAMVIRNLIILAAALLTGMEIKDFF